MGDIGTASLLFADGPFGELPEGANIYEPLIGSWEIESRWFSPGGERRCLGEWHFARILGGLGVQDVLFPKGASAAGRGTTLRCYDRSIDAWRITWMMPTSLEFSSLVGRRVGDRIVQEGVDPASGRSLRWSFADIEPESFEWIGEASEDSGKTWVLEQEMRAARMRDGGIA